jgi:hypothetical protein
VKERNVASYKARSWDINTRPVYFVSSYMTIKSDNTGNIPHSKFCCKLNVPELPNFLSL